MQAAAPDFAETVRWGLKTDKTLQAGKSKARENKILSDKTVRDNVEAAASFDDDGDVDRMILLLATTDARFSQVQRICVGNLQIDRHSIFIPNSRKGQGKLDDHYVAQVSPDVIETLRSAISGRTHDAPLLERWRMVRLANWNGSAIIAVGRRLRPKLQGSGRSFASA